MEETDIWKIIHSHFEDNPQSLVRHHIESYDDFFKNGIFQIMKDKNPITIYSQFDEEINDYRHKCTFYFGGKNADKVYFGKPVIYDDNDSHYMFPNEARLRNMNYGMTIHYDLEIEYTDILSEGQAPYPIEPNMVGGEGLSKYYPLDLDVVEPFIDYSTLHHRSHTNFKQKGDNERGDKEEDENLTDAAIQELLGTSTVGADATSATISAISVAGGEGQVFTGGMPPKVPRKKKGVDLAAQTTANIAAKLREATEESLEKGKRSNAFVVQTRTTIKEKIYLGTFPIMVQSHFCVLNGLPREVRYNMGECKNDVGGYFIIDGKEKTIVPQEKFADNMLYVRKGKKADDFLCAAEIKSVSENVAKPIRTLSMYLKAPTSKLRYENIVVNIPNVRSPVPLFIVFRALGVIKDKDIIQMCLLDLDKHESLMDLFIPSVHDSGNIMSQYLALKYIALLTKFKTIDYALEILTDYFLPHVGETNFIQKAYFLGYMTFRLLSVHTGLERPTDRDHLKHKRLELVGNLMSGLFREYYNIQLREIHLEFEKRVHNNQNMYAENLPALVEQNYRDIFKEKLTVHAGFKKAFKGNWGAFAHTKKIGVVQDLNRLSFNSMISHLRKTNLPMDSSMKLVEPRVLIGSHWGFFDPIDTPDGANIGLHKTLAITTYVSRGYSREQMVAWLREKVSMKLTEDCGPEMAGSMTKVMVNGYWCGMVNNPVEVIEKIRLFRRNALIPIHTSATFHITMNEIQIFTDAGRLTRPIFYLDSATKKPSYQKKAILDKLKKNDFTWDDLTTGFNEKKIQKTVRATNSAFNQGGESNPRIYELHELYQGIDAETNPARLERFIEGNAIIDYIDANESENTKIALNSGELEKNTKENYTHLEIHESLIFGVMCNQIIYPEHNPPTRDSFSCGQSKQAVSLYNTNFQMRMDKAAVVLNYGEVPLVKSRYLQYINNEEHPYGENAIVAIMCYTGYNVEDAVLLNEGALKRGLFQTTYYTTYEAHEESSKNQSSVVDKHFTNIESQDNVVGTKPGYDYSKLDNYGLIRENTAVDDKTVLIGLTAKSGGIQVDQSKMPKKGQLGVVDKTFMTQNEEGSRIAKVRVREVRIPNLGDKMASRSGQKGTVGLVIPEADMPFTKDGIRPDIIINPHAIPSRMTIGQLIECIIGKGCAHYGGFGDCTAFVNKGSKVELMGRHLVKAGFHSSGNELLYNGMTGEQIESAIFIGPTYYMRLKHMVKDKINYRALGPRAALTRQPVGGRANDGGLRIGEMERDSLLGHGLNSMLTESMMERGDKYYVAICNQSGLIAIYNPSKNLFMSPMADGPIKFVGLIDGKEMHIENITKFGRSFSVVRVPYSFKLLVQELQAMNIQMRVITEDNISQIESMSFSKNIQKLTHTEGENDYTKIANMLEQAKLEKKMELKMQKKPSPLAKYVAYTQPEEEDGPSPRTPDGLPPTGVPLTGVPRTPDYAPESPNYGPSSGIPEPFTPEYAPETPRPDYVPSGLPRTPEYAPEMGGGATDDYELGQMVCYVRDPNPNRIWYVKDYNGEFYTIETNDTNGLYNIQDSIKVVSPTDLRTLEEQNEIMQHSLSTMPFAQQQALYQNAHLQQQQQQQHMMDSMSHGIHVAPVIKIVNGPDHSVETQAQPTTQNTQTTMSQAQPHIQIQPPQTPSPQQQQQTQQQPSNEGGIVNMSGESADKIDFSKIMIRKV